jgi:hypothetical protein
MLTSAMASNDPIGFTPAPVPPSDRGVMREVALVYRRCQRTGLSELASRDAAARRYLELRPDAAGDPIEASGRVSQLIASAVTIDPRWFWHGPGA